MKSLPITRRSFLKSSLTAAAALSTRSVWAEPIGANGDIRVAVVGFNGRGRGHISSFREIPGVRVAALCDADKDVLAREAQYFQKKGEKIGTYTDIRELLEDKEIDAISIATPNHWHALMSIWACQAGKDVYVEKPVSHNVWEGRQIVHAARKYNRIVQTGTQSRSSTAFRDAFAWVRSGQLGKIKVARGLCYKRRPSIGKVDGPQPIPASVDYDLWCGPAPKEPLMRKRLHYDWHWVWPTGNGDLGNQGIHQMDLARWALGKNELSRKVFSVGGRLGYIDDGQTPNTQMVIHDFGDALLIFEVRGLPAAPNAKEMDKYRGEDVGHVIECEGGYLAGKTAYDWNGKQIRTFSGGEDHFANFIKAVRSRKVRDLNSDIVEGHLSSALCHTGNISYQLGRQRNQDELREELRASPEALETLERMEEHLRRNEVDLRKTPLVLGAFLKMNPKTEKFVQNRQADEWLTRDYRAPYVVPKKV